MLKQIFIPADHEIGVTRQGAGDQIIVIGVAEELRDIIGYVHQLAEAGDQGYKADSGFIVEVALEFGILQDAVEFFE